MKKLMLLALAGTAFVVSSLLSHPAGAEEFVPVDTSPTLPASSLMITGYQAAADGLDLVQLYNNGNSLLVLDGMTLKYSQVGSEEIAGVPLTGNLEPGRHTIVAALDVLQGVSEVAGRFMPAGLAPKSVWVEVTGYANVVLPSDVATGAYYKRNRTTSGAYSTATSAFAKVTASPVIIEIDDLYHAPAPVAARVVEVYPYASSCAPNDTSTLCGDYIKLYNPTNQEILLDGFVLRTDSSSASRTTSNTFRLDGRSIDPHGYTTIWLNDDNARISLTNSGGYVWLEDVWNLGDYISTMTQYESAGASLQGNAWALIGGTWQWTNQPNPVGENKVSIVTPGMGSGSTLGECPAGKYRNPETNRCRTIEEAVNALAACDEGKERNPATNRCRSIVSASTSLTPCGAGQERNPATNRCRSVLGASTTLQPCGEGKERNPATNRCRNVAVALADTAYPVQPIANSQGDKLGWLAFGFVGLLAAGYGIWEWRSEIGAGLLRLRRAILKI